MASIGAFFAKPLIKYGAIALVLLGLVGFALWYIDDVRDEGAEAGASTVINEVQAETIKKLHEAQQSKEKTDEEVRRTPYDDRVDGL